ncbi:hypothetical protein BV20DRAFT_1052464 [Pilatotrama ljubarskyi]|nr:hypothetical protein BV20DRAFT_1052464 [Pilatotrama ljubarskyi]
MPAGKADGSHRSNHSGCSDLSSLSALTPSPPPVEDAEQRYATVVQWQRDVILKSKTIKSCPSTAEEQFVEIAYPADAAGSPIQIYDMLSYSRTHVFIEGISCFCAYLHGTRRSVNLYVARQGPHAGDVCLGCPEQAPHSVQPHADNGCQYFFSLNSLSDHMLSLPLREYPIRGGAFIGRRPKKMEQERDAPGEAPVPSPSQSHDASTILRKALLTPSPLPPPSQSVPHVSGNSPSMDDIEDEAAFEEALVFRRRFDLTDDEERIVMELLDTQ